MSEAERTRLALEDAVGQVKEAVGDLVGSEDLREAGQEEQARANLEAAGEDVEGVLGS
jgi:uncharacterized protein YjbJ (UPF0337 family)